MRRAAASRQWGALTYKPEFLARITERRAALRAELAVLLAKHPAITWEIGSGHGHFLVQYASAFPDKFCVGVDSTGTTSLHTSGRFAEAMHAASALAAVKLSPANKSDVA